LCPCTGGRGWANGGQGNGGGALERGAAPGGAAVAGRPLQGCFHSSPADAGGALSRPTNVRARNSSASAQHPREWQPLPGGAARDGRNRSAITCATALGRQRRTVTGKPAAGGRPTRRRVERRPRLPKRTVPDAARRPPLRCTSRSCAWQPPLMWSSAAAAMVSQCRRRRPPPTNHQLNCRHCVSRCSAAAAAQHQRAPRRLAAAAAH